MAAAATTSLFICLFSFVCGTGDFIPAHCSFSSLFYQENPFLSFLKKEVQKVFQECKMIAVVQNNASNAEDMMVLKHRLHKHGMAVKLFPNQVMAHLVASCCRFGLERTSSPFQVMLSFLKDTVYSNMAPLFIGPNLLIVSNEPKAKELLASLRASPQITLLGGCAFCFYVHGSKRKELSSQSGGVGIRGSPVGLPNLDVCCVQARVSTTPC